MMNFCSAVITFQKKSQEAYSSLEMFDEIETKNDLVVKESNSIKICQKFLKQGTPIKTKSILKSKGTKKTQPNQLNEAMYEQPIQSASSSFISVNSTTSSGSKKRRDRASRMKSKAALQQSPISKSISYETPSKYQRALRNSMPPIPVY